MNETIWDAIIVGAGPAGLSAALYLARYRRRTLVIHDGTSRASRIPLTHNAPGFPAGIAGCDLLQRMTDHAVAFGASIEEGRVAAARSRDTCFELELESGGNRRARSLILATGVHMNQVDLDPVTHEAAMTAGTLRYCPICDGFEHKDEMIGVVGCDSQGAAEALFLRTYSKHVTLIPKQAKELSAEVAATLRAAGIIVVDKPIARFEPRGNCMDIHLEGTEAPLSFDVVYPALGLTPRTELAEGLGLACEERGTLPALAPFGLPMAGLYAAGDVVEGLDQLSVAMAHGSIAATRAHNWLRQQDGSTLPDGWRPGAAKTG